MKMKTWWVALVLLLGTQGLALAQTDTGRISGTVIDQTGGFIANAAVKTRRASRSTPWRGTTAMPETPSWTHWLHAA